MIIKWIKCSERMPPDDDSEIFIRKLNCIEYQQTPANEIWFDVDPEDLYKFEWMPCNEETLIILNEYKD